MKWQRELILQTLIDKLDTGVHIVDRSGTTRYYNPKMAAIEGMDVSDVVDRPIQEVFPFSQKEPSTLLEVLEKGREARGRQQTYLNAYGKEITTVNHTFPIFEGDDVRGAVELAKDVTRLEQFIYQNTKKQAGRFTFTNIIGDSSAMREVIEETKRATRTSSSVLIVGETGTGKELFAQSIHTGSERSDKPFISQNCAAIPEQLLESILFGTTSGAFTGAKERPGLFEQAEGGTLLLDEVNSLEPSLQAKLLRVLQDKHIRRLGGTKDRKIDVRIIATMNEDPIEAIQKGHLRRDLYYRLNVVTILVPPLRERREDIRTLAATFIEKYNQLFQMGVEGLSQELDEVLQTHSFLGNVRELEHLIEGAMNIIDEQEEWLKIEHLPKYFARKQQRSMNVRQSEEGKNRLPFHAHMKQCEEQYLQAALHAYGGNITQTAQAIGMSRQTLQYRLKKIKNQGSF